MDRKRLLEILKEENINSYIELLVSYCVEEHNKPTEETKTFINVIAQTTFFSNCLKVAIEYYSKKFNIIRVIDLKTNNTILIY